MQRLLACFVAWRSAWWPGGPPQPAAAPVPGISQPSGSVPIPEGPAQAWIVADMDSGAVLAARDEYGQYAPASTIKVLLALTVLDELPLDTTVVATEADTKVECNCAGVVPGHVYTARQLLEALLLVSGNDAANTLATMLGGQETAVMKMNAKAALLGAYGTNVGSPSGLDGPGIDMWTLAARPCRHLPRRDGQPGVRPDHLAAEHRLLHQDRRQGAGQSGRVAQALSRRHRRQDRLHRHRPARRSSALRERNGRRLVIAMMFGLDKEGGPTYWDQAASLLDWGFALDPSASVGSL